MRSKPLAGIRVLDLTRLLPGPMCTLHLADMGADVIKIEDPGAGDYARSQSFGGEGRGAMFRCLNRNKRGLRLDLRKPEGRAVFLDLARSARVVVESFRPGVMDRLGVGYAEVRQANPRIVYCAISGYGQDGPYRERAGHDIDYCAYAGVLEQCGPADGAPVPPNFQIADLAGGALSAVMGILAALLDVERGGAGRFIDAAMTDCTLTHAIVPLLALLDGGEPPRRGRGMLTGGLPCYAVYETADGLYMALGALEEKFWRSFCAAVDRPDLAPRHRVSGAEADAVRAEVAAIFRSNTRAYWTEKLAVAGCCAAPVLTLTEAMENEQLRARGVFVDDRGRAGGDVTQFAFPLKLSEFEFSVERPPPAPGEHGAEILAELGYDPQRIAALREDGVI